MPGDNAVAEPGTSECLLGITTGTDGEVDAVVGRAPRAGATVTAEPGQQPWGYAATFADPDGHLWTVTAASWPADLQPPHLGDHHLVDQRGGTVSGAR